MWQSKKNHTSFVKSFLHHEPEDGLSTGDPGRREEGGADPKSSAQWKSQQDKANAAVQELIKPSSFDEEEIFLRVLGI